MRTVPRLPPLLALTASLLLLGSFPTPLLAHPGGLDAYGGHNNRKAGGYHFHRGSLSGQSFGSKAEGHAALDAQQGSTPATVPSNAARSSEDRLDKLIQVLIRKGIITEAELAGVLLAPTDETVAPLGLQQASPQSEATASSPAADTPDYTAAPQPTGTKDVSVRGYYRKDGTYVRPHTRSRPRR